jgi:hypothetical protein
MVRSAHIIWPTYIADAAHVVLVDAAEAPALIAQGFTIASEEGRQ